MLSRKAKRELKIDQRQVLIDSIEIGIPSPEQILIWGERDLPNGKKAGLVKNSKTVNYKRFTPFRDGLFCERIFGPVTSFVCACGKRQVHTKMAFCEKCEVQYTDQRSRRYRLGYISLLSPVTHIWYLKGRPSYLSLFLGKRKKTILALAYCNAYLVEHGISSKDKNNIKEKVSLGHYRSKICNAKQDLPLRQNIKAPNPFRQVLKTETKALKSFVKIRQLKNSSSSLNSFAHVSEKDSIGAQSFCQEAIENIKANSFLRTSAPSLVTTDQRSVTQSKTCPYKSSICKGNIPTKPSFVRGMRKQDQEIQTGSLSYKKNFYIRQQSLPFLPSLVCNFYLRDAILDFVSSPPSSRDTPLFSYCNIKRWDVLRNVHKFMAQQSVSKFKKTPIVTQKQSFKTNSKNNLGFATRLSTLPSKVFASRTKAGSYPACLYTCKTGHRLSFISDKDLFKHKLLLTRLCKGLFPISYKTKPYKSKKTACKQVKSNTKNILGFASRHIFDARTGLALCYRSSISNDQDFHVQSKALQEDVTKSLKIARARPSFLKKKRVYKKTKSKQFFSLSDALLDYTTQAHKRMSLFYKAQANIQSFAQLVQAYKFTQKLSYCKQNTLRDKQKKDYLRQNNQAPAKTISLQKQAFLSSFYDLDYLAELEKRGSLSPKQINNFSLFQTEKSFYIKEGKVSSAFLYKAEFTNYSKSDQETQYINASINSLGCALERLNSFGVMDKLSVELSLRDDIRWREKWAVTSLSKTSKQVVQLLTKPKLVRKLFFDETKLCFGKANVFESSYKAELSSCAINRNVCLKKTKDNTCRQSLIRKNKNIALTNPIFLRTGFAKQSQGPKTSLSAYKNFSDNCKAYFRKTSNRGISFCYDQSVTRQKQDPQSNKKVCLFCPKGYVSLPKRSFVKGQLMPIFDKAQSQGCSTKNVMPFFTDRRSVTQSKASPKNETKKIRKIEQDFVPKSKTTPLVSGLELTAIREILSYTGGGALKQILQCFTIHSFEKFLFAETEILRNRYKKGILFFPNATPTDIPRLVPGSSFCGVTKHSKAMPLQIQNLNRQSDMSQGRVITDQRSVTQNKSKPSKKSTANDFLKAPFAAKAGDYESKICNAKQDQGNKAANALGEKQNLRSCALQVKQSCARQRVSHLWSMENKTTICKSLRQSFDLAKPMPAHLQRICPYKACAKQSFAKSDLRTPWKARQYKSSICKGKFINFNSKNFFQSKTSRSTTYPALYHVQKLNRTELAKDREQSLSLFAKQDFAQHNVCRHSIHTVSHTDTRKTKLSKNFTSLKSFANCKSQYQDLEKKSVVRFSRRIYKNSRRLKIVQLLTRNKRRPEWMILSHLPVLPPDLRPILQMSENLIVASDLNNLYQRVIYRNNRHYRLRFIDFHLVTAIQRLVQDAVDRLIENGKGSSKPYYTVGGRPLKSLSDTLKGKKGRFRLNLLGKRVDFSGRSVIVVSPSCKIHECGLPKDIALELYHYFLLRQLILRKHCSSIVIAKKMIKENSALILDILRDLIYHHPVLLNRAPTLHRLGIQAFQPKLVLGSAILLHPLVCSAFNADFDGDQMGVHLPLSFSARAESWDLLWSRNNLLSPATGQPMLIPSQDMVLGFYYMTALAPILYNPWPYKGKNSAQLMPCNAVFGKGRHTKNVCITKHKLLEENTSSCEKYAILPKDATLSTSSVFSKSLTKQRFSTTLKNFISSKESFLQERHLFSSIIEMIGFYQKGKIFLHTPVWLKWNGKIESDEYSQRPLELRINSFASSQYICPQYKRSTSYTKTNIFYPTHTSASKQATDERFHFANLKNRASCINQSSLPSASTYTANTYTKNMEVNTSTVCPAFAEHTKPGLGRPKDKTKETKQRLELLTSTDVVFTFRISKAKQTNYVRTSVGRVLVNNILET